MSGPSLDFSRVFRGEATFDDLFGGLALADVRRETADLYDRLQAGVFDCVDADVSFVAQDTAAAEGEGWTIGHLIAHITATCEESAFLGAEMARGVPFHGRSCYEVPWESLVTIEQVRERIADSRRMCLACLEVWPSTADLDQTIEVWPDGPIVNAAGRHAVGLAHGFGHLPQLEEICRQAKAARA
jgi:hypothetical protein